jgi:phosphatidylinositol alpha-mannosyltransferase
MRLLFTIPDFWPYVRRGSERLVHDLGVEMTRRGHTVTVVTRNLERRSVTRHYDGMRVEYRRSRARIPGWLGWTDLEAFSLNAMARATRHAADVYHGFYLADGSALTLVARVRRRPVVISVHGMPDREHWQRHHPRTHRWFMRAMRAGAHVAVISEHSAKRFHEDYGVDPILLIPGVFTGGFSVPRESHEHRDIVCAAAIDESRKRIDVLLAAFVRLAADLQDIRLVLVGPGDPAAVHQQLDSVEPKIASRVLIRHTATEELPEIYAHSDVGALTSVKEAFGLVVVEYLAAGMPAVGSDDAALPEIITEQTGALFRGDDVDSCATALDRALALARDPATAARCRARAGAFDWSIRSQAYDALYRRLSGS